MKIMFYINTVQRGGAERVLVNLANYLAMHGHNIYVVTSFRGTSEYALNNAVIRLTMEEKETKRSRLVRNISRIYKLRKFCKENKVDVLISFMAEPNFRALVATIGLGIKNIVSVRNDPNKEYEGRLMHIIGKYLLPTADGCVFQTDEAKQWFPKRLQEKSNIICNAVNPIFYNVERKNIKNNIIAVGRLEKQKNHALLISAFSRIADKHPSVNLEIYGSGSLKEALQRIIDDNNLSNRIFLKGHIKNVENILSSARLFVLSSDYEGMPNALMEAMAVGVPVLSTDCPCGGPRSLIGNELPECLFSVGDEVELSKKINTILSDDALYDKITDISKRLAENFAPDIIHKIWEKYIISVLER